MKTIFLTIFEGTEAKNLLRTSVVSTLLSDPNIRVVLFTKSLERADYYRREFKNDRLLYEVVERKASKGFDTLFAVLKFVALKTRTTDLKRYLAFQDRGNYALYAASKTLNWFLARPRMRKLVRFLDFHLVTTDIYGRFFDQYAPELVLMAHLFDEPEVHLLREARRRGVKTVGLINSWDKTTSRAILRLLPDKCIVFNNIVKQELVEHNDVLPENIYVSGLPQYDDYANLANLTLRETFLSQVGASQTEPLLVYAPLGTAFSASDWKMIDVLHQLNVEGAFGVSVSIFVRFQPNDFIDPEELRKRPTLLYDYPGKRFSSKRGVDWDMDAKDLSRLKDTLYHMSLLVCYASSMSIDAAWFDKPVININFEIDRPLKAAHSTTQYFQSDHYRKALLSGGIRLVNSREDLVVAVRAYLDNPALDREGRNRLIQEQCVFKDGMSGYRIGRFLLSMV